MVDPREITPRRISRRTSKSGEVPSRASGARGFHQCPLCGTILEKHERVKSVLYPGKPDGIMEIYGCPYCFGPQSRNTRTCPVCSRSLSEGDIVYARFFESPQRKHVHVLGCPGCYTRPGRS